MSLKDSGQEAEVDITPTQTTWILRQTTDTPSCLQPQIIVVTTVRVFRLKRVKHCKRMLLKRRMQSSEV